MHHRLLERFHNDFPQYVDPQGESNWRIECGSGWALLLYSFFLDVKALCDETGAVMEIGQIKEKFGSLRLYCSFKGDEVKEANQSYMPEHYGHIFSVRPYPKNPTLANLIAFYENISAHCCELCGNPGHIDDAVTEKTHWVSTLCYPHAKLLIERKTLNEDIGIEAIREETCKIMEEKIEKLRAKRNE